MLASRRFAMIFGLVLTALSASPLMADEPPPEKRVALVIGNSHYRHALALANPEFDAHAMSDAFRRLGIDVTEGYDLSEKEMRALLVKFANAMVGAKGAIVFYAGHGVALDGVNYMLPVDIDLKSPADLDVNGVSVDLVLRQMRRDDRVNVVILDACRENPFAAVMSRSAVRAAVASRGLQPIGGDLARGALIAFATEPGAPALDGTAGAHSPFTAALLRHIEDASTPIETVMSRVRSDVFAATDSKQLPWVNTSIVGDFELNPHKAEPPPPPPPPRDAAATQATENLMWESAERSRSPEDYKTYLATFPNGVFAPLARRRIEPPPPALPAPAETAETALQLTPTDRAMTRRSLNVVGGGDPFGEDVRAALRAWQKSQGYAATGYLDKAELTVLKNDAAQPVVSPPPPSVTPERPPRTAALTPPHAAPPAPTPPQPLVRSIAAPPRKVVAPDIAAIVKPKHVKPRPRPAARVAAVAEEAPAPAQSPAETPASGAGYRGAGTALTGPTMTIGELWHTFKRRHGW